MKDDRVCLGYGRSLYVTERAIKIYLNEYDDEVWFPHTHIHDDSEVWEAGQEGEVVVTKWIAEQKGYA